MSVIDNNPQPLIAVDFDDTLCMSVFPECGEPIPGGKEALQRFKRLGYLILIYSCRGCHWHHEQFGTTREEAVKDRVGFQNMKAWLDERGYPYDELYDGSKGKPMADFYIDDKGIRFENNWEQIADFIVFQTLREKP